MTALIVDDLTLNLLVSSAMLKSLGFEVHTVRSGEEAIEVCKTSAMDLILMDYHMPGMNGAQAIEEIRTHEGQSSVRSAFIIGASGQPTVALEAFMLESGANVILNKPFSCKELSLCIQEANLSVDQQRD